MLGPGCEHGRFEDMCNKDCDAGHGRQSRDWICGQDGIVYPSHCHLRKSECLQGFSIGIAEKEFCGIVCSIVYKHVLPDCCRLESFRRRDRVTDTVVSFDHHCIIRTANALNVGKLARPSKLEEVLNEALSKYRTWRSGSEIGRKSLYRALSVLHAAELLVEQGKLHGPYEQIIDSTSHDELSRQGSAARLPLFHSAVDACSSTFLRSAAIVDAVQVLNETYGPVFQYSPLMDDKCLFSLSFRWRCEALDNAGSSSKMQWLFQGTEVLSDWGRRHTIDSRGDLIIRKVRPDDLGLYTCLVTSESGKTTNSTVRLSADSKIFLLFMQVRL